MCVYLLGIDSIVVWSHDIRKERKGKEKGKREERKGEERKGEMREEVYLLG
jgi:hypothetical protein